MIVRRCQAPGCDESLEARRPQTRVCSDRCQKRLDRERVAAPGAEALLARTRIWKLVESGELTPEKGIEYASLADDPEALLARLQEASAA